MGEPLSPAEIAVSYLASFASGDPEAIAAHVSNGFVNEHASALGGGSTGRDAYLDRLPGFLARFVGLAYRVERVIADGTDVAVTYTLTATSDGHPVNVRGVMVFEVVDGLITRRTDYWDSLGYLRQIGAAEVGDR